MFYFKKRIRQVIYEKTDKKCRCISPVKKTIEYQNNHVQKKFNT